MIKKPFKYILRKLFWIFFRHFISDKQYAKFRYWLELDESLDLKYPQKFTEKIQYIKLYKSSNLRKRVADRKLVREYVSDKVGDDYLIPLIGIYDELNNEIWGSLPVQFVLKANHGCGMTKIITDKSSESYDEIFIQTEKWKDFDYAKYGREWIYRDLPRTLLAENLLLNENNSVPEDYKFFCFEGRVELIQVDFKRFGDQKRNLYDRNFNQFDATLLYPTYKKPVPRPQNLEKAVQVAEVLSSDFNFIRVDLYLPDEKIYFGELTNYPGNGFAQFSPLSFEYKMGNLLKL